MSAPRAGRPHQVATALVLAAGNSTRIRTVAGDTPKPLIEVAGSSVLERNLRQLAGAGVREVWINLHYQADQIRQRIGDGHAYGLNVRYSYEPDLLGTAGAARKLKEELGGAPFLVVYGDNLVSLHFDELIAQHWRLESIATIAVYDRDHVPNTGLAGGRVVLGADRSSVLDFREGDPNVSSPFVNAGVYVLQPEVLGLVSDDCPSDFGRDVFPNLLRLGHRVSAYLIDGYCLAIDTPDGLARAEALLGQVHKAAVLKAAK